LLNKLCKQIIIKAMGSLLMMIQLNVL